MSFVPAFLSEWDDHIIADCVPASGVMLANKITHNRYPSTVAEREALQNAMGTQDTGANALQLTGGMFKRYGLRLAPAVGGWTAIAAALADPTKGVALFGRYHLLPAALRNQSLQPGFGADGSYDGHCIYAQGGLIGDPLGTHMIAAKASDLKAFSDALNGMAVIGQEQATTIVGYRALVGPGSVTFYRVARFTHTLYGPKSVGFSRAGGSPAPVAKGAKGFWMITAGPLTGYYLVFGKSVPFQIQAIYSDGHVERANPAI